MMTHLFGVIFSDKQKYKIQKEVKKRKKRNYYKRFQLSKWCCAKSFYFYDEVIVQELFTKNIKIERITGRYLWKS